MVKNNEPKSKIMTCSSLEEHDTIRVKTDGDKLEEVREFLYL